MKIEVIIDEKGGMRASLAKGTFEEGSVVLDKLLGEIKAMGIELDAGPIERHFHDTPPIANKVNADG